MEDSVIQTRNELYKIKKISLNEERENNKLTLRKKKINEILLKKRLNNTNINNLQSELEINEELLNIRKEHKINFNLLKEEIYKITDYLSSQNINYIKYAIHLLKEYSVNNDLTNEDIEIIKQFKTLDLLGLILQTYNNDIQIVNEIIWIFINIQVNGSSDKDFLLSIISEKLLMLYLNLLNSNYDKIVISILWMLDDLVIHEKYKTIIFNHNIIEKIIDLSNLEICDVELSQYCLQFFSTLVHSLKYNKNNERDKNILNEIIKISCINLFNKNYASYYLSYKILSYISEISDKDLLLKIEKEGAVVKILKSKFKNDNIEIVLCGVKIISNLLCGSNQLIEDLIKMRVVDFYENILKQFPQEKQIILYSLFGLFNLSATKYEYKRCLINCIIFNETSFNYLIQSCDNFIHDIICDIMYNLSSTKNIEMLKFLYDKKAILKIVYLAYQEKNNKENLLKYIKIIERYIHSFKDKEKDYIEYKNIEELYQNLINNNTNIMDLLDDNSLNLFSQN